MSCFCACFYLEAPASPLITAKVFASVSACRQSSPVLVHAPLSYPVVRFPYIVLCCDNRPPAHSTGFAGLWLICEILAEVRVQKFPHSEAALCHKRCCDRLSAYLNSGRQRRRLWHAIGALLRRVALTPLISTTVEFSPREHGRWKKSHMSYRCGSVNTAGLSAHNVSGLALTWPSPNRLPHNAQPQ